MFQPYQVQISMCDFGIWNLEFASFNLRIRSSLREQNRTRGINLIRGVRGKGLRLWKTRFGLRFCLISCQHQACRVQTNTDRLIELMSIFKRDFSGPAGVFLASTALYAVTAYPSVAGNVSELLRSSLQIFQAVTMVSFLPLLVLMALHILPVIHFSL